MAFLKSIESHTLEFQSVHAELDSLKRQNNELQSLVLALQSDITTLKAKDSERSNRKSGGYGGGARWSFGRVGDAVRERRKSFGSSREGSSRGSGGV